jgi:hypothetical protein
MMINIYKTSKAYYIKLFVGAEFIGQVKTLNPYVQLDLPGRGSHEGFYGLD